MIQCQFRPISEWPTTPTRSPKPSQFKAKWSQTLDVLERELNHLRAKDIIIEAYFEFHHIRNDGWPKSLAKPSKPGVVLSFEVPKKGRMIMPCDRFDHWEANLRAIALTLEHLRAVERYGVTTDRQEQYTGWLKLPAANPAEQRTQYAKTLILYSGQLADEAKVIADPVEFDRIWRTAARKVHPDAGGNADFFRDVIAARDELKKLNGWK